MRRRPPRKREPLGTVRKGQLILGIAGALICLGFAAGLQFAPIVFVPLAQVLAALLANVRVWRPPSDPDYWTFIALLLGVLWTALSVYAYWRQPAQDEAVDRELRRRMMYDNARHSSPDSEI